MVQVFNSLKPKRLIYSSCWLNYQVSSAYKVSSQLQQRLEKMASGENTCKFRKEEDIASGKWLKLTSITFSDPTGKERLWEAVCRTTKLSEDTADAVVAIPILRRTLHYDCVVLVKQYWPPMKAYSIEFPAGLIDAADTVESCAVRELKEETGYVGMVKHISPATSLDPGMSGTTANLVTVEIDGDLSENQKPKPTPDEGEFIEVLKVPLDDLLETLKVYTNEGMVVDSRVYTYAISMEQTRKMMRPKTLS